MTPCRTAPYSASVSARWMNLRSNSRMESAHESGYLYGSHYAMCNDRLRIDVYLCTSYHSPRSTWRERIVAVEHCVLCNRLRPGGIHRTTHDASCPEPVSSSDGQFNPASSVVCGTRAPICNGGISGFIRICFTHDGQFFHPGHCLVCQLPASAAALATGSRSNTN